jgi:4-oxalocrotonate tautomerase
LTHTVKPVSIPCIAGRLRAGPAGSSPDTEQSDGVAFVITKRLRFPVGRQDRCAFGNRPYSSFTEERVMPLIQVKLIEGVFTEAQKHEMVRKLTDAMVSIEGENMRPVTWVVVEEVRSGDWGIGGKSLTTADVKALAAGKPAR